MASSSKSGSRRDPSSQLSGLGESGETGVLQVAPVAGLPSDVYLMGGEIIACETGEDRRLLADLLVAAGALDADVMAATLDGLGPDDDLADTLVSGGAVDGRQVMEARSALFRDNIAWALAWSGSETSFEAQDAVFPPNMQFGLDREQILTEVWTWRERVAEVLGLVGSDRRWTSGAQRPPGCDRETWANLAEARTIDQLLALLPPPRRVAAEKLALWLHMGVLVDPDASLSPELGEAEPDEGKIEAEPDESGAHAGDHYAKAAAGGYIKSYEVLDKVDLSGLEVVGEAERGPPSLEAIEAVDFDDDFETHADTGEAPEDPDPLDTRPSLQPLSFLEGGDLESGDFEIFEEESEDSELVVDDVSAESLVAVSLKEDDADDAGTSASINLEGLDSLFTREQLNEFHERISVFNNIFRIVFGTFAEHISPEKALQRFNALLGSGQRQYPELFKDLKVEPDGTIAPSALINNLTACPPGDYGSLLHQGLYELIFSHLYDAKDMLPGDAEMQMMEKIVVFERQLHQM